MLAAVVRFAAIAAIAAIAVAVVVVAAVVVAAVVAPVVADVVVVVVAAVVAAAVVQAACKDYMEVQDMRARAAQPRQAFWQSAKASSFSRLAAVAGVSTMVNCSWIVLVMATFCRKATT